MMSCQNKSGCLTYKDNDTQIKVTLERQTDSLFLLNLWVNDSLNSTWPLEYPVFRFDYGDVTGNSVPDIAVGVIKPTRYDPKPDKRLFLFKITEDYYIRPLWLGSRVSQPLEDFRVSENNNKQPAYIKTIEKESDGTFLIAEYKWRGFGLEHIRYIERNITWQQAQNSLKNN